RVYDVESGGLDPAAFEELLHAGEEAGAFGARILVAFTLELLEQLALALGQVLRRFDLNLNVHVAVGLRAEHGHAFALEAELLAALRTFRDLHACDAAFDRRHLDLAAERGGAHRDWNHAENVGTVTLEEFVRFDGQENVEVARAPAAQARLTLTGKPNAGAVLDASRDVHRQSTLAHHAARAGAARARILDDLTTAMTARAGPLDSKETLRGAHFSETGTGRAACRPGAGLCSGSRALLTGNAGRHANLRRLPC